MQHFRQQVYFWVQQIPKGTVASYGQIAKLAGFPRHARHVSKALGCADKSLKLPWFRVIGANGKIAFNPDSDSFAKQKCLLEKEGVQFKQDTIDMKQFAWQPVNTDNQQLSGLMAEEFFR
ncbi:MAG: methylated-DNA--[protein]-cysteine S-methyltransferase [Kangiellaceae bacterium]|nr:methylated-DNA--[protein]-cysteine S-methyltransferase [Kangiellaceae bacterium]